MDTRTPCGELPDFKAAGDISHQDFDDVLTKIGPHSYTLKIPERFIKKDRVQINVIGCQGSGSQAQKNVAELMRNEPLLLFVLGDNIYNHGASSPTDQKFKTQFYDMQYPAPAIVIIGNHDGDYDKKSAYSNRYAGYTMGAVRRAVGWALEKYQVLATYLPTQTYTMAQQVAKFQRDVLDRDQLSAWNMPYTYYSLIVGEKEFFCINSNAIFADYLAYCDAVDKGETPDPLKNQVAWLERQYKIAIDAGRMPILLSHHPADITLGKRISSFDAWHYISDEQMVALNKRLQIDPPTQSFTEFFRRLLNERQLSFPFKISAHDHFINYVNDPANNICQLTMGAGGGALHDFSKFNHPHSGCQIEQYGFAELTVPLKNNAPADKKIDIDIHTLDGLHLKFDTLDHRPMRWEGTKEYEALRNKILILSYAFFNDMKPVEKKKTTSMYGFFGQMVTGSVEVVSQAYEYMTKQEKEKKEPGIVQDIVAYFNQLESPTYDMAVTFLREKRELLAKFGGEHSFGSQLEKALSEIFSITTVKIFSPDGLKVAFDE